MGSKKRTGRRRAVPKVEPWAGPAPAATPVEMVSGAVDALVLGREGDGVDLAAARLADAESAPWAAACSGALVQALLQAVAGAWSRGWQPAEAVRQVRRVRGPVAASMCADTVAADLARYAPATVDPRWSEQVGDLGARGPVRAPEEYLAWAGAEYGLLRFEVVEAALRLLADLRVLPPLRPLGPLPGAYRPGRAAASHRAAGIDQGKLARVRALLAKAESTEFPSEAEALSARAQELMARHSIDRALLDAEPGASPAGAARRLPVEAPYDEYKAVLLHEVAEANHCRAVWDSALGLCTVMGFEGDLAAVEVMFTSLLVQLESAMRAQGSVRDKSGRAAGRAYRESFVSAFAARVGERLVSSARAAEASAAAETGTDLVPVFAERERRVEEAVAEAFGELTYSRVRGPTDADGWDEGRAAADAASLDTRRPVRDR